MENEVDKVEQAFTDTMTARRFQELLERGNQRATSYITASTAETLRRLTVADLVDLRDVGRS